MKALVLAIAALCSGCFTTWVGIRAAGYPGAADESVREERVPVAGIQERLIVTLDRTYNRFQCKAIQQGNDTVYHSAFRYGSKFKTTMAIAAVTEALVATALYLGKPDDPGHILGGAFFAADAVGTTVLAFIPRKEIYRSEVAPVTTTLREICPDNLSVDIAGETYPIDASGHIGELGWVALDDWMRTPNGSLLVTFDGRSAELRSDVTLFAATFDVPVGTLAPVALR